MSDENTFLAECEEAATGAVAIAGEATEDWYFDDKSHELQKVLSTGQPVKIGHIIDHHDGTFAAHARTSNPDLAARVFQLVKMVKERDQRIEDLNEQARIAEEERYDLMMESKEERNGVED